MYCTRKERGAQGGLQSLSLEQLEGCKCSRVRQGGVQAEWMRGQEQESGPDPVGWKCSLNSHVEMWRRQLAMQILSLGSSPGWQNKT